MVVEAEEERRWYLQVYCSPPGTALMWAQSRARQGEGFRDAHSLFSLFCLKFCRMKIYDRLYLYFPSKSGNVVEGRAGSGECPQ